MVLQGIDECKMPNSAFIHVCGKISGENEESDIVINVDKIDYIKSLPNEQTLISFAGISVIVDYSYYDFNEVFLNRVNLLLHLNKD